MPILSEVLMRHTDRLMSISGVVGTGEGIHNGKPCILILISKMSDELVHQIPKEIEGYPVVLKEIGEVKAMNMNDG